MNAEQVALVQQSFDKVQAISETAAELFYNRLFEIDPSTRPLFKGDMKEQGRKLMATLAFAVNGLDRLEEIAPAVADLGKRHVGYGVVDEQYNSVGAALLWTLEQGLGEDFTEPVREAWTEVYTLLAEVMKKAAAEA